MSRHKTTMAHGPLYVSALQNGWVRYAVLGLYQQVSVCYTHPHTPYPLLHLHTHMQNKCVQSTVLGLYQQVSVCYTHPHTTPHTLPTPALTHPHTINVYNLQYYGCAMR